MQGAGLVVGVVGLMGGDLDCAQGEERGDCDMPGLRGEEERRCAMKGVSAVGVAVLPWRKLARSRAVGVCRWEDPCVKEVCCAVVAIDGGPTKRRSGMDALAVACTEC